MSAKESCASGGTKEDDDIKAAELRDEILFKQPESSHLGDCPICCLPLSLDAHQNNKTSCCGKTLCGGCDYANYKREFEQRMQPMCPFCRHPAPKSDEEADINYMKRVEANDPAAICYMGDVSLLEGDYGKSFEYWTKAAELGHIDAHYNLSMLYHNGHGVEKDMKKQLYHLEEAAIGGHVDARHILGYLEKENGRGYRALKHMIIAANMGHDDSLGVIKESFKMGIVSKEDFAAVLRAHRAAVVATISPQRKEAEAVRQKMKAASSARQK